MKNLAAVVLLACCAGASLPVAADLFSLSHSCVKPYKPWQFNSEWELENFRSEVESYKRCINNFVDEQSDATRKHQDAAAQAIDEWNHFVNYELN
jgi:hypothetical protein